MNGYENFLIDYSVNKIRGVYGVDVYKIDYNYDCVDWLFV